MHSYNSGSMKLPLSAVNLVFITKRAAMLQIVQSIATAKTCGGVKSIFEPTVQIVSCDSRPSISVSRVLGRSQSTWEMTSRMPGHGNARLWFESEDKYKLKMVLGRRRFAPCTIISNRRNNLAEMH